MEPRRSSLCAKRLANDVLTAGQREGRGGRGQRHGGQVKGEAAAVRGVQEEGTARHRTCQLRATGADRRKERSLKRILGNNPSYFCCLFVVGLLVG